MVTESEAESALRAAHSFVSNPSSRRTRDFVFARPTTADGDEESKAYDVGAIAFHSNILNEAEQIVEDFLENQINAALEGEGKQFGAYDIGNADKDEQPLQYLDAEELPDFGRFSEVVSGTDPPETEYPGGTRPEFQAIRVKDSDGNMVVAFQKYSTRQIVGRRWRLKVSLRGDNEYDRFQEDLFGIPERVDALYYDGVLFVKDQNRFEDIFDYLEHYEERATEVFDGLEETDIRIHNFEEFHESVMGDRRALRKMRRVKQLGLYEDLERGEVEEIVEGFDLGIHVEENEDGEWGIRVPDLRKKWDVIRLLNDDHLYSSLTEGRYQVYGKEDRSD